MRSAPASAWSSHEILEATGSGSERIVDAHVVAVCVPAGGGLVVTSDASDIAALAAAVPAARIHTTES
ncbi:MAG: hypothetical protein WD830_12440 [Chloroflexota bacterium]